MLFSTQILLDINIRHLCIPAYASVNNLQKFYVPLKRDHCHKAKGGLFWQSMHRGHRGPVFRPVHCLAYNRDMDSDPDTQTWLVWVIPRGVNLLIFGVQPWGSVGREVWAKKPHRGWIVGMGCVKSHIKAKVKNVTVSENVFLQKKKVFGEGKGREVRTGRHCPNFFRLSTEAKEGQGLQCF